MECCWGWVAKKLQRLILFWFTVLKKMHTLYTYLGILTDYLSVIFHNSVLRYHYSCHSAAHAVNRNQCWMSVKNWLLELMRYWRFLAHCPRRHSSWCSTHHPDHLVLQDHLVRELRWKRFRNINLMMIISVQSQVENFDKSQRIHSHKDSCH